MARYMAALEPVARLWRAVRRHGIIEFKRAASGLESSSQAETMQLLWLEVRKEDAGDASEN